MDLLELLALILAGGGVWLWLDSLKAREIGRRAAEQACRDENMQFLDDTVAIRRVGWGRDDGGLLRLRRVYGFEYSDTGDNRRQGSVTLLGHEVELIHVRPQLFVVPRSEHTHENQH